jgi:hypothetical protein
MIQQFHFWVPTQKDWKEGPEETLVHSHPQQHHSQCLKAEATPVSMTDEWLTKCGIHIQWIGRKINRRKSWHMLQHGWTPKTWPYSNVSGQCHWSVHLKRIKMGNFILCNFFEGGSCYVAQAGLELLSSSDSSASASQVGVQTIVLAYIKFTTI